MKNKKIIGLIFVVVAFILIAVGGIGLSKSNKNTNSKNDKSKVEESYADKKTDRNYQATTKVPAGSYISTNKEVVKQTAADIGLKKLFAKKSIVLFLIMVIKWINFKIIFRLVSMMIIQLVM